MKILIIKLGLSETLDHDNGKIVSLGDVLRTTPILEALKNKYEDSKIVFLTDYKAEELVKDNPYIDKLLLWDEFIGFLLLKERYDIVINLEKHPGICALADMIDAWQKFGFRLDENIDEIGEYNQNISFIDYINNKTLKKDFWQKILIEHLGITWNSQRYSLGYKPKTKETFDIGLNYFVGTKWPTKAMSKSKWEELHDALTKEGFTVTWQEGLSNLCEYMDWINNSKVIITQDSLGLHLAMAFNKKVIGLFGATGHDEVYPYDDTKFISSPSSCTKMPCYCQECDNDTFCMDEIPIHEIVKNIKDIYK